jgi:hypothetical protein
VVPQCKERIPTSFFLLIHHNTRLNNHEPNSVPSPHQDKPHAKW